MNCIKKIPPHRSCIIPILGYIRPPGGKFWNWWSCQLVGHKHIFRLGGSFAKFCEKFWFNLDEICWLGVEMIFLWFHDSFFNTLTIFFQIFYKTQIFWKTKLSIYTSLIYLCYYSGHLSVVVVVRHPSTVARFLAAGPIDLKLGGWVPWPKRVWRFFHFSDLTLYVATRGRYPQTHFGHFQANGNS